MKIVILDGYTENPGDLSWACLETYGKVVAYDRTPAEQIVERIGDAEIVVTNKAPLSAEILAACPNLKCIAVTATGYNVVDCAAAKARGIPVCNVPAYGTMAVAQYTIGMLLELCHHVSHHSETVHEGRWSACPDFCYWDMPLIALEGKTMGIIGFGNIGRQTGRIAKTMGMRVLAFNRSRCPEGEQIAEYVPLDTLLQQSDIIALHCPLSAQTQNIINAENIAKMKDGVLIVNTARGPLVDEAALAAALKSGKVAGAAVDVVSTEPIRPDNPLLAAPNCFITPHIAWASRECRQRIMDVTAANIGAFLKGEPQNVVNS